ncbi:bifunctional metallophosphatase/5'-nucleotidase [Jeotgalibacillus soli]|uniref:2',3'-cyclic-nucleotide 2'-phosphodiesterase n=1 Tax=Jeotgalibacillus soli TaxID=889306 RepID=A0A0C2R6J6_9BACL|nr:bifunctional UDP-sugar hydrolase/5'-nucleotidase [Jeotgalibacillus soli]KIL45875.1 2',3'-cyclic-nucleotide 2'-phosphodiesterase [Jeotgalibacillus soli]
MVLDRVTFTVLETSDVHGHVTPTSYATKLPVPSGLARASSFIKRVREEAQPVLLIDNGDMIQGTPLMYHYVKFRQHLPNPTISVMNYMNYDSATIGNHEFNYGMSVLSKAISQSNFPWLSANIVHKVTKESYFGFPYCVKILDGNVKVVILGITTHYIPNWENPSYIKELSFEDALVAMKNWVNFIHETEKPDFVIVSYHGGLERDPETGEQTEELTGENQGYQICQEIDGIDLLLTGHQHRELTTRINRTFVMQPGYSAQSIGKIDVTLKRNGTSWSIETIDGEVVSLQDEQPDPEVLKIVHYHELETQKWLDQPLGLIEGDMTIKDPMGVRLKEHPMIEWINQVQMEAAGVSISNTSLFNNESLGFPSNVTMRDIVSNYIYPNTLTVLELSYEDIKEALEKSASYFMIEKNEIIVNPAFTTPKPQHYNYDMWEGITYTINVSKPIGERIVELMIEDEKQNASGRYHVVMNNYRAGGGGDYSMFKGKPIIKEILTDMAELLADHLEHHKKIKATVNNNWQVTQSSLKSDN